MSDYDDEDFDLNDRVEDKGKKGAGKTTAKSGAMASNASESRKPRRKKPKTETKPPAGSQTS